MIMNDIDGLAFIKQKIDELLEKQSSIVIGIDGMAASGKTTLARNLKKQYKAEVIHMDDFFLQDYQKTNERLREVDGFIDYERFSEEVLGPLKKSSSFTYHAYNCQTKMMTDMYIDNDCGVYIIEGAYALKESFNHIYDLKILMLIDDVKQLSRLSERNHPHLVERFKQDWIPRENKYIKQYSLDKSVDCVIMVE